MLITRLKGGRGGPGSEKIFSLVLTYFKIWNMGIQELLTELKKITVVPRYELATYFAKFREMYGKSQNLGGLKISF